MLSSRPLIPEAQLSHLSTHPHSASRGLLCAVPFSALVLGLQASAPLSGSSTAPSVVNWVLLLLLILGAGELFRRGDAVNRVAVVFVLVAILQLLSITDWFQTVSNDHLAS